MADLPHAEVFLTFAVDHLVTYLTEGTADFPAAVRAALMPEFVDELLLLRGGDRSLVQNTVVNHVHRTIGAQFCSPFLLHSRASNRSLLFLHLSQTWQARDVIGQVHWQAASGIADHRGDPGFEAVPAGDKDEVLDGVLAGILAVRPSDPIEGMLVANLMSANAAALEMYRRAWLDGKSFDLRMKYLALADKASRSVVMSVGYARRLRRDRSCDWSAIDPGRHETDAQARYRTSLWRATVSRSPAIIARRVRALALAGAVD